MDGDRFEDFEKEFSDDGNVGDDASNAGNNEANASGGHDVNNQTPDEDQSSVLDEFDDGNDGNSSLDSFYEDTDVNADATAADPDFVTVDDFDGHEEDYALLDFNSQATEDDEADGEPIAESEPDDDDSQDIASDSDDDGNSNPANGQDFNRKVLMVMGAMMVVAVVVVFGVLFLSGSPTPPPTAPNPVANDFNGSKQAAINDDVDRNQLSNGTGSTTGTGTTMDETRGRTTTTTGPDVNSGAVTEEGNGPASGDFIVVTDDAGDVESVDTRAVIEEEFKNSVIEGVSDNIIAALKEYSTVEEDYYKQLDAKLDKLLATRQQLRETTADSSQLQARTEQLQQQNQELDQQIAQLSAELEEAQNAQKEMKGKYEWVRHLNNEKAAMIKKLKAKLNNVFVDKEEARTHVLGDWRIIGMSPDMICVQNKKAPAQGTKLLFEGDQLNGVKIQSIDINSGKVVTSKGTMEFERS